MRFYALFGAAHYCTCGRALDSCYLEVDAADDVTARREIWVRRCSRYSHYVRELPMQQPHAGSSPLRRVEGNLPNAPRCFCGAAPQPSGPIGAINQDIHDIRVQSGVLREMADALYDLMPLAGEERVRQLHLAVLKLSAIHDYFHALLSATNYDETKVALARGDYDD